MIRRNKEQWLELLQQQTASGLSAVEFCEQNNLCSKYFSLRKNKLLKIAPLNNFVPVVVQSNENRTSQRAFSDIDFQCQFERYSFKFSSLPDPMWLAQLVKALS